MKFHIITLLYFSIFHLVFQSNAQLDEKRFLIELDSTLTVNYSESIEFKLDALSIVFEDLWFKSLDTCETQTDLNIMSYNWMIAIKKQLNAEFDSLKERVDKTDRRMLVKCHRKWERLLKFEFKSHFPRSKMNGSETPYLECRFYSERYILRCFYYRNLMIRMVK